MSDTPTEPSDNTAPLRALANPVRLQILSLLNGSRMSATDIAKRMGIQHASASYHLRNLKRAGLVEIAETRNVSGGIERLYRPAIPPPIPDNYQISQDLPLVVEAIYTVLQQRAQISQPGRHATIDGEFWVPLAVWDQVMAEIQEAAHKLHESALLPGTPGAVRGSITALLFMLNDVHKEDDSEAGPMS